MLQRQPNCAELKLMDFFIQILCRFQKCKQKVPPPSPLKNQPWGTKRKNLKKNLLLKKTPFLFFSTEEGRWRNFSLTFSESTKNLVVIIHRS